MTIDFTCQKCEGTFEIDAEDLIDRTEKLICPHCDAKAPANLVEDFIAAITEMRLQVAVLSKKFTMAFSIESEDVEGEEVDADEEEEEDDDEDDDDLDGEDDDEEEVEEEEDAER